MLINEPLLLKKILKLDLVIFIFSSKYFKNFGYIKINIKISEKNIMQNNLCEKKLKIIAVVKIKLFIISEVMKDIIAKLNRFDL